MPRDPKVDPQAGDIVSVDPTGCLVRFVSYRHPNRVTFASRLGKQWFNTTFKDTLKEWQWAVANGVVLKTGQGPIESAYEGDDAKAGIASDEKTIAGTRTSKTKAPKKKRSTAGTAAPARKARRKTDGRLS